MNIDPEYAVCRGCGHAKMAHKRHVSGALACSIFGCGCSDFESRDSEPHEVSEEEAPNCPTCLTGYCIELGTLGLRTHYRCRNCGAEFSQVEEPDMSTPAAVARLIVRDWAKVHYAAKPYLEAMLTLGSINDDHWHDSGQSVVRYFLNNARSYRTPRAAAYKAALKKMAGMK